MIYWHNRLLYSDENTIANYSNTMGGCVHTWSKKFRHKMVLAIWFHLWQVFKKSGEWLLLWVNVGSNRKQNLLGENNGLFPYLGASSTQKSKLWRKLLKLHTWFVYFPECILHSSNKLTSKDFPKILRRVI